MELKIITTDLGILKKFFDFLPKDDQGRLEVITQDNQVLENPTWLDIKSNYSPNYPLTFKYTHKD